MAFYYLIIIACVQGITEFLPVSSSGHLVLVHDMMGGAGPHARWRDDLLLDVAVHVGTLFSALLYFRRDIMRMLTSLFNVAFGSGQRSRDVSLAGFLIISSLPVIFAGFLLHLWSPAWLRTPPVIALTTIVFGLLLWWVDARKPLSKTLDEMTWKHAVWIGLAQVLALIPGTSRSGITMTAARYYGFSRTEAARYALLLGIIAISGAGTLGGISLYKIGDLAFTLDVLMAMGLAFISGWLAIALMMRWLRRATFGVFALYRVVLGVGILAFWYI